MGSKLSPSSMRNTSYEIEGLSGEKGQSIFGQTSSFVQWIGQHWYIDNDNTQTILASAKGAEKFIKIQGVSLI